MAGRSFATLGIVLAVLGCAPEKRTVGGTVSGLTGVLLLRQGTATVSLSQNGPYAFPTELPEGATYLVTVATQPQNQVCQIANGSGTMGQGPVKDVDVTCEAIDPNATFLVRVTVTGLSGSLVLLNQGGDALQLSNDGVFTFATPVASGSAYRVTVGAQPAGQACTVTQGAGTVGNADVEVGVACQPGFVISGAATYGYVPADDGGGVTSPHLDYAAAVARPARRAVVQAIEGVSGQDVVVDERQALDDGSFALSVPLGHTVSIRLLARSQGVGYVADGIGSDHCNGATWELQVLNNTAGRALYAVQTTTTYSAPTSGTGIHAAVSHDGSNYTNRAAAPFALLDTALEVIELVCEASPGVSLPVLDINWSPTNRSSGSIDYATGAIGTSSYLRRDIDGSVRSQLYILGQQNVDTDEYDDHVIAHETGHFIEDRLYRSDSVGGPHGFGDVLSPSVAFSEGYGNAVSGMTFNDSIYVDTSQAAQADGFAFDVGDAPSGNDRGVHSEDSVQYLLWSLYDNRDVSPQSGSFDRIHAVLAEDQAPASALTSLQGFAAFYNARFGAAESLQTLWTVNLALPLNSLCVGACTGSGDVADPFDIDNDLGQAYAAGRFYPPPATSKSAEFWRLYRTLASGTTSGNAHDVTDRGGYGSAASNKWGFVRAYRLVGSGAQTTVSVQNLGGGKSCGTDYLDLYAFGPGRDDAHILDANEDGGGCPSVTFATSAGADYVVVVQGYLDEVSSWDMVVSP